MNNVGKVLCLLALLCGGEVVWARISLLKLSGGGFVKNGCYQQVQSVSMEEALEQLKAGSEFSRARVRRSASDGSPSSHGNHSFPDKNNRATIQYSGFNSPVIFVLTYSQNTQRQPFNSQLYRSSDYGKSFSNILTLLDPQDNSPALWNSFFVSTLDHKKVVFVHATKPLLYLSLDEGQSWNKTSASPSTLNLKTIRWNSVNDEAALVHDPSTDKLYVSEDLGQSWLKIADNVDDGSGYQWADPDFDEDPTTVYYNVYDPADHKLGRNVTKYLFTQHAPFTTATQQEFDSTLGRHDDFLLLGPYIYVQKTDSQGVISLYTSYGRANFKKAKIPSTQPHLNYLVSHIDALQALVVIQHSSGQFNMYLSELTAEFFSLSLSYLTHSRFTLDLDIISGVNGTLMANQYIGGSTTSRSLISLDNGANWELVRPPAAADCTPPDCSLHLHMSTTGYYRTAIYSQASAPGLILANGNTGRRLSTNPDLYISRDGGVTWSLTLQGSWGMTIVDHGGLLVAAQDHHQGASTTLKYSCDEGLHWSSYIFSNYPVVVYGVITEPGEHTTIVSLYGTPSSNDHVWDVLSMDFQAVFPRNCSSSDFYDWHPWDDRTDQACLLGSDVTIQRRNSSVCCLIGRTYSRPTSFTVCSCTADDFECAYGYQHADSFNGKCVRDSSVTLDPICTTSDQELYKKSRGYQKVAGDVCVGGVEEDFLPMMAPCPVTCSPPVAIVVLSVILGLFVLATVTLAFTTSYFFCKWSQVRRVERVHQRAPRVQFRSTDRETSSGSTTGQRPLLNPSSTADEDDDDPLAL